MKKIIKIAIFLIASTTVIAQSTHEISLFGSGGISTLNFTPTIGEREFDFGGNFGMNYTFLFSESWGLKTGAGLALFSSVININHLQTRSTAFDVIENTDFEFRSQLNNFRENQQVFMLQIPLMLQHESVLRNPNRQFYFSAGLKIGIPFAGTFQSSIGHISNSGFYAFENNEYRDIQEVGFHNLTNLTTNGNLDFNLAIFASAEIGMRWWLRSGRALFTGVFVDFGLNNFVETHNCASLRRPLVEFNPLHPKINSVFHSHHTQTIEQPFVNTVRPIAIGITLRFVLNRERLPEFSEDDGIL